MYRKAGSQSVLSGALSGPYTGGTKKLDAALLDATVRERLSRAIGGRGSPAPIASDRPVSKETVRAMWGLILSTMLLTWLFALGFADLSSRWALPPLWMAGLYIALGVVFALCLLPLVRRRALYGGGARGALRPGRYLFPLDVVLVSLPDPMGGQTIEVTPLGDARDGRVEEGGKLVELVISFEGGERMRFPLRGDPAGEIALRRLEHAQRLIEELTYKHSLEQAFANDIFFDVRVDRSWAKLARTGSEADVRPSTLLTLVLGRFAQPAFLALGVVLGVGSFAARRSSGDLALFEAAERLNSVEALDRYLARGGSRQLAALDHRQRLLDRKAVDARRGSTDRANNFAPPPTEEERCLDGLTRRASPAHPEVAAYLANGLRTTHGLRNNLWLEFVDDLGADVPRAELDLPAAESTFARALAYVFSEVCPSAILYLRHGHRGEGEQGIVVHTRVSAGHPWDLDVTAATMRRLTFAFQADVIGVDGKRLAGFALTLAPPAEPPTKTRDRSLYDLPSSAEPAQLVHLAQTARAYDRLYDEVWSLLFDGDPEVVWGRIHQP